MQIKTIFEDGYSWIEIEDVVWKRAVFVEVMDGIELDWFR